MASRSWPSAAAAAVTWNPSGSIPGRHPSGDNHGDRSSRSEAMNRHFLARMWMLLASLAMPAAELSAQARSNLQGTIDSVMLDERYIVVDGERMPLREDELVVTWKGEALRP